MWNYVDSSCFLQQQPPTQRGKINAKTQELNTATQNALQSTQDKQAVIQSLRT
ncbi:hypothetical protein [Helicobacter bizzozeronii]|uniref:Uncharacterized protein n=1 Tax=Helicobacter bizzozeronii (strain CIII-1) TaxID=1002804 RepID=F8KUH3_HELBC|nr:hypothetical protein [Helicobacter bizzozeronii]CCB80908.1 hypothetical protein HBZC1_p0280 [Helicobacter bizzozeronii CIII-1]